MFAATGKGSAGVAVALLVGVSVLPTIALQLGGSRSRAKTHKNNI